jgi:omega-6 fatty acid desaturase (delta-12 desaturase)
MLSQSDSAENRPGKPDWYESTANYMLPNRSKAARQVLNTFIPYGILWALMVYTLSQGYSYWLTLALAMAAGVMLVRVFIIFHDCCHGSFFASKRANRIMGYISGILTFTPYEDWRRAHAIHHSTAGDLDRRGIGDITMLTVEEYRAATKWKKFAYRFYRNPFVMFGLGPTYLFLVTFRFSQKGARKHERNSVLFTNLALLAILGIAGMTIGLGTYLVIQLPVMVIAGAIGVWLFYIQHDFEGVYWARHKDWDHMRASLEGSSYYKLPPILQWFSGNIGLHHIHHIRPRIPNYNLQQCYNDTPPLQKIIPLTISKSLKSPWLNLWDEKNHTLVSFRSLKAYNQTGVM